MKKNKLLIVGLDGADWRYIDYSIKNGKLPTIKKLIEEGCSGSLRSIIPPTTFPVWLCFSAGQNPGRLGYYGYIQKIKGEYKTKMETGSAFLKINPFWKILNEHKIKVGIVNIPSNLPATKTSEFMVCIGESYYSSKGLAFPKELEQEINRGIGKLTYETNFAYFNKSHDEQFRESMLYLKNRSKLNEFLLKKYKSKLNLFMTVFMPDSLQHFIIDKNKMEKYYSALDEEIRKLIGLYHPDNILIISDHGGGEVKKDFYVNEFLIKNGFLKIKKQRKRFLNKIGINLENIQKIFSFLKLDVKIVKLLPRSLIQDRIKNAIPSKAILIEDAEIDWGRTTAYCLTDNGGIYLNLKGREPQGIVNQKDYERVLSRITEKLKNLKDPETKENIRAEVYRKEQVYKGRYLDEAPDLVYVLDNWDYVPKTRLPGEIFKNSRDLGNHKLHGVLIASGKSIRKGKVENAEFLDVTPTILSLFGIKKPGDMDGKILDIFK